MLRGHVDLVTPTGVSGWAADEASPERVVEVSIFADDVKIAQVPCNRLRLDLAQTGRYGDGAHGFAYEFTQAFPDLGPSKIAVRFTNSGNLVGNTEFTLSPAGAVRLPSPASISENIPITLPAPATPAGMVNLFALYQQETGLFPLLSRLDYRDRGPAETWYSVFGQAIPAELYNLAIAAPYSARDDLHACLTSDGFQRNIVPTVLRAFPEKQRLIFVHVPKCAGTHLTVHLKQLYPSLDQGMAIPHWTPRHELFRRLSWFARLLPLYDAIFVSGHTQLRFYAEQGLLRPSDRVFTVLRDPVDILISQLNYVLTRMTADSSSCSLGQDTREWLQMLGLEFPDDPTDPAWLERVATKAVRHPNIIPKNPICYWLGQWTAETALSLLRLNSVEITETSRFDLWMKQSWGVESGRRFNESRAFFTRNSLPPPLLDQIRNKVSEDWTLYARVAEALDRSGTSSINGRSL